jgi:hypothetical protein
LFLAAPCTDQFLTLHFSGTSALREAGTRRLQLLTFSVRLPLFEGHTSHLPLCSSFVARYKTGHYNSYVSRSMLTFTGRLPVGAGLDGCSRETLDFLVSYNPDSILLHDSKVLHNGLKKGKWIEISTGDLMYSALVVGATPVDIPPDATSAFLQSEELAVFNAVSVEPESRIMLERLLNGQLSSAALERPSNFASPDLTFGALRLNRVTLFLFTVRFTSSPYLPSTHHLYLTARLVSDELFCFACYDGHFCTFCRITSGFYNLGDWRPEPIRYSDCDIPLYLFVAGSISPSA